MIPQGRHQPSTPAVSYPQLPAWSSASSWWRSSSRTDVKRRTSAPASALTSTIVRQPVLDRHPESKDLPDAVTWSPQLVGLGAEHDPYGGVRAAGEVAHDAGDLGRV